MKMPVRMLDPAVMGMLMRVQMILISVALLDTAKFPECERESR
jgi:hypothetical protein